MYCFNSSLYSTHVNKQIHFRKIADPSGFSNAAPETKHIVCGDFNINIARNTRKIIWIDKNSIGKRLFLLKSDKPTRETNQSKICLDLFYSSHDGYIEILKMSLTNEKNLENR